MEKQTYLALGTLLLAAGAYGVDATPMEGFDAARLDAEFGLRDKGLTSIVLVALGYRGEADFNAKLPKSRLPGEVVFTFL
jgi:nitroreductase/dihydropteridine reductase